MSFQLIASIAALVFPALVIAAALKDATSFTIPNWISLALLAAFVPAAFTLSLGELGLSAAVFALCLISGMGMFALGWIGGGDAKLFAVAGLWLGWPAAMTFGLVTAIAGGALAVTLLVARQGWLGPYAASGPAWFVRLTSRDEAVPYGIAIAVGALAAFPESALFR